MVIYLSKCLRYFGEAETELKRKIKLAKCFQEQVFFWRFFLAQYKTKFFIVHNYHQTQGQ